MIQITPEQMTTLMNKAGDNAFRAAAKKDARAALESAGVKVPAGTSVAVHENGPSEIHAVLPEKGNVDALKQADPHVAKVFEKAWADAAFKAELLKNPAAAIKSATSQKLPSGLKIVIHENTANAVHVVMPYLPPASGELSDNDLETVAGGKAGPGGNPFGLSGQPMSGQTSRPPTTAVYPGGFGGAGGFGGPGRPK